MDQHRDPNVRKKAIMAFAFLVGLNQGVVLMNIPPALTELMSVYGVSYTNISILISGLLWSHALMHLPAGMITDRLGIGRTLLMCLACMFLGNIVPAMFSDFKLAVLGRVVTGIGTGTCFVVTLKLIALHAPRGRAGSYQAFFGSFFSLGNVLAYLIIPRLIHFGWQWTYILPAVMSLFLLAILPLLRLDTSSATAPSPLPLREIISIPAGWVLGFYHALSWGSMLTLGYWIPSLLEEVWIGSAATELAWGGALVMLISGLARLSGGIVLLKFSPVLIANGSISILCILFLSLFAISAPGLVLSLAILAAWFSSVNFGAFFHLASRSTSSDSLGTFLGFMNLLATMGAVVFTVMFGWMKDHVGSFSWGFLVLAALSLLALASGRRVLRNQLTDM
jgi:predicted MFS family arabinose efflux permease